MHTTGSYSARKKNDIFFRIALSIEESQSDRDEYLTDGIEGANESKWTIGEEDANGG